MKITTLVGAGLVSALALCAIPTLVIAQSAPAAKTDLMPRAKVQAGYKAARRDDGHPDISGVWSNATLTPLTRQATFGTRLVMTPQELAERETSTLERNQRQNAATSQQAIETWTKTGTQPDRADECRSGSTGAACGYNAGWTDPGDLVMRVGGEPRTSLVTFPANGQMPARVGGRGGAGRGGAAGAGRGAGRGGAGAPGAPAAGRAAQPRIVADEGGGEGGPATTRPGQNDNPEGRSLGERCVMSFGVSSGPVMTSQLYNNTYRFVQTKTSVAIWVEMVHDVRVVRLNSTHRTDGVRPYMGDSIGWWDGDTLVVETINYNPGQNARGGDENLKVTERFTRVAPTRLHYAFQVEDPTVWAEAWGGEYEFATAPEIYEYACHEGNYGLEGILAGARHEEEEARAARTGTPVVDNRAQVNR